MKKKVMILPVREPWARMLASGEKKLEFRVWIPKCPVGTEIWIVATGRAESPRKVIAKGVYAGTYIVSGNYGDYYLNKPSGNNGYLPLDQYSHITNDEIMEWGGNVGDYAIKFNLITKFEKPFTLESIGIGRTPMKFQYFEYEADTPDAMPSWRQVGR